MIVPLYCQLKKASGNFPYIMKKDTMVQVNIFDF